MRGYDERKTRNPEDDRCEFCGVHAMHCRSGWQPDSCTGECNRRWRDPDEEYERQRDAQ